MNTALILKMNEFELIKLAKNSNDETILKFLAKSIYTTVRRCVAKNLYTSKRVINALSRDSAQNVSYCANENPNCTTKREIKATNPCTLCKVNEEDYSKICSSCRKKV